MKLKKNLGKYFLFVLLFVLAVNQAFSQARKYSNEFLSLGVGSRAFGMSNAVVASSNDVYAGYWNPAGLSNMQGNVQVGLMHSEYFGSIAKYDYGAVAYKIDDQSNIALSVIRFGVDDIPNTTELIDAGGNINYDRISLFSAVDYAFIGSYAHKTKNERLRIGANVKVVNRKIGDFAEAWGFGIDIGTQYKMGHFTFAAMARDISTTFNAWSYTLDAATIDAFQRTGNTIPENGIEITTPKLIIGTAYETKLSNKVGLNAEIDMQISTDGERNTLINLKPLSVDPYAGLEFDYRKIVFLRSGIGNIQRTTDFDASKNLTIQPNFGIGLRIKSVYIDYALTDIGDLSDAIYSNVFSIKVEI